MPCRQDASYCPICFSCIMQRGSATSAHSTMASRQHATRSEPCTYSGPAFDPSRVLLRRVFFLNEEKSRYVSVGFYPVYNYRPLVEIVGTRIQPLVLSTEYFNIVVERQPVLLEAMCLNEHFVWGSKDKDFKMHRTRAYRNSRFTRNKHGISLKLPELRTLQYILHIITYQLYMYTETFADVHAYVNTTMTSCGFIEPGPNASKSIIYRQLFDELKSPVY